MSIRCVTKGNNALGALLHDCVASCAQVLAVHYKKCCALATVEGLPFAEDPARLIKGFVDLVLTGPPQEFKASFEQALDAYQPPAAHGMVASKWSIHRRDTEGEVQACVPLLVANKAAWKELSISRAFSISFREGWRHVLGVKT